MMRILLAGEGRTELGEWAKEPTYRDQPGEKGVLVALLERAGPQARSVIDGIQWMKIRKYQAGAHAGAEARNVLGLALMATERLCDAVLFTRDRDGDRDRERDLEDGIRRARETFAGLHVAGGIAIEAMECWLLVLVGVPGEELSSQAAKAELARRGIITVEHKVGVVSAARFDNLPAGSLRAWFVRAGSVFALSTSNASTAQG